MPSSEAQVEAAEGAAYVKTIARLSRRLARERAARLEAELTAERGLRDLYTAKRDLDLFCHVAAKANTANRVDEILGPAVNAILDATGWPLSAVYEMNTSLMDGAPACLTISRRDDLASLVTLVEQGCLILDPKSEAACALESGQVFFGADLKHDPMPFVHRILAENSGLRSTIMVPVRTRERLVAVMRFMAPLLPNDQQRLGVLLGQVTDQMARVYERQHMTEQLLHDSLHDPLTRLANRQLFIDRVDRAAYGKRAGGIDYSVLFLDLDRFKAVNDTLGHTAGDNLLIEVASRISQTVAAYRLLPEPTVARIGGDEFCILIENEADPDGTIGHGLACDLVSQISRPFTLGNDRAEIGVSIGVAPSSHAFSSGELVLKSADTAMYGAKSNGRGQVLIYDQELKELDVRRDRLITCMREAVNEGCRGFTVVYQPIVAMATAQPRGFEALLRFVDDTGTSVGADEFIPLAEENGLIQELGQFVFDAALEAQSRFNASVPHNRQFTISINVSPLQLSSSFALMVREALHRHGTNPRLVWIEITEGVVIDTSDRTMNALKALRDLGLNVSIDDFGSGYATFGSLRQFSFETLKIDRCFIEALMAGEGDKIVKAIIDMGHGLGVSVVAEGIETSEQAHRLRELGCDNAQGYHFSRPMIFDELMESIVLKSKCTELHAA